MRRPNYPNDPPDAKCPFCGSSDAICSWIDSVPRSWARQACQKRYLKQASPLQPQQESDSDASE